MWKEKEAVELGIPDAYIVSEKIPPLRVFIEGLDHRRSRVPYDFQTFSRPWNIDIRGRNNLRPWYAGSEVRQMGCSCSFLISSFLWMYRV
jgi:hypothetical protein